MQFTARLVAFSAAISQALALVALTNSNWDVTEGTPFEITWTDADGAVTLLLKDGPSSNLATVATIASKPQVPAHHEMGSWFSNRCSVTDSVPY